MPLTSKVRTPALSGSLTKLTDGTSYLIAGANVTVTTGSSGAVTIASTASGGGGSGDAGASYVVLSATGSLANERVLTAGEGISVTDSGAGGNVTIALSGLTVTASVYSGYCTGSLQWGSTTWADFHTVVGNFTDSLQNGITRSDSTFTVVSGGLYYFQSDFNYLNPAGYTAWRLSGSNGTIIQRTKYGGDDGSGGILTGIFSAVANETFKFQYAWKNNVGYVSIWIPTDPIDGENMRTGVINIFRIADPFKYSTGSDPGGSDTQVQFNDGGVLSGDSGFSYNKITNALSSSFMVATSGFSGSLTKLTDGTSYLVAGNNVSITTGSTGAVTISSTASGGGDSFFSSTTSGSIFTSGSVAIRGGESAVDAPSDKGTDVFFYVSGSTEAGSGVSLFGGNVTTSGSLRAASSTSTGSFGGNLEVTGTTHLAAISENLVNSVGGTGTVNFNLASQGIFYVNGPTGDITANFQNVPTTNLRVITPTVILSQSSTARTVSAVQIDGAAQTVNWANNLTPVGTSGKQDVFGFSLIRSGSAWKVLGQMSTYG